jgi:iron complex outermembrane receptor protein
VTVITHAQIKESGARTIPDAVSLVAGLNIRWNPMVQTMDIRGFGSNPFTSRLLLMIDGVPFNAGDKGGFPQQPALDFFVLQNVKRIEIVRGPGSALYGENAFWGVSTS